MQQITLAATAEQLEYVREIRDEMARWDSAQAQMIGYDPTEVLSLFYPVEDQPSLGAAESNERVWLLATYAGKAAGCAALQRIDENTSELQYVYVRNEFRGKRIGRLMVEKLVATSKAAGYSTMRLQTVTYMKEARSLYKSLGFMPCEPFHSIPKIYAPAIIFMELPLAPTRK
jgi:ribosomal protein S18 acetylase RimI-like enzyme